MTDVIKEINGVTCRFRYLEETSEEWLAHLREVEAKEEAKERRKDEAGAKAAQELADKKLRHLNKKVRDDPTWPNNCTHRIMDGEVPLPQLDEIIHVPDHPELKICDDRTGALSNSAVATATEWNKKFGKQYASKPVTLQTSKGNLTFEKKNKNVDGGQKTVAGYCCSVEGKEYWIHDSNKPTLYPPTYLAFELHKYNADPDYYNSREAISKEYEHLGFPNKTPKNIRRCRTDWLSMVMPIIHNNAQNPRDSLDWLEREHPEIYQEIYQGNRAHGINQFHEVVRERRDQMTFNELAFNGVRVQWPYALKICKHCLQRWKESPRADCNCIMCTDVKNLDENTDHVLFLKIDPETHGYVNNPAGNEVRGPGERGAGKRRKTLRPLNGGNPCVLHYCNSYLGPSRGTHSFYGCVLGGEIGYDGHQWKMQWEREADDTPQNP